MNRRGFLGALAAALTIDPERALWVPGAKLISIPASVRPPRDVIFGMDQLGHVGLVSSLDAMRAGILDIIHQELHGRPLVTLPLERMPGYPKEALGGTLLIGESLQGKSIENERLYRYYDGHRGEYISRLEVLVRL